MLSDISSSTLDNNSSKNSSLFNDKSNIIYNSINFTEINDKDIPCAKLVEDNIELVLVTNRDIEIAIPVLDDINPELLAIPRKYELYKYCIAIPISFVIVVIIVYYLI
jgi:hypothetical protein